MISGFRIDDLCMNLRGVEHLRALATNQQALYWGLGMGMEVPCRIVGGLLVTLQEHQGLKVTGTQLV